MNTIKVLTADQINVKNAYARKWIEAAHAPDNVSQEEATTIVNDLRMRLEIDARPVVVVDNPIEAWVVCRLHMCGVPTDELITKMHAVFDGDRTYKMTQGLAGTCGVAHVASIAQSDTIINGLGVRANAKITEDLRVWTQTARVWDVHLLEELSVVCRKPVEFHRDADGVVSKTDGPAIVFGGRGDFKINVVNGRQVA